MSEISSNSEEPILTKAELLKTRYNEYIALVEYARTNETTLSDDTRPVSYTHLTLPTKRIV